MNNFPRPPCPICTQLRDVETSFHKYDAPEYDRSLPDAAAQLEILQPPGAADVQDRHVRRCPNCGALYAYRTSYEYFVNGSEDEEELTRLSGMDMALYHLEQARALELLRRKIDAAETAAGEWVDLVDWTHPVPEEQAQALAQALLVKTERLAVAATLRQQLVDWVAYYRRSCPETLEKWAIAHLCVCTHYFIDVKHKRGDDVRLAQAVAYATRAAWGRLLDGGEVYVPINTNWLVDYERLLDNELDIC